MRCIFFRRRLCVACWKHTHSISAFFFSRSSLLSSEILSVSGVCSSDGFFFKICIKFSCASTRDDSLASLSSIMVHWALISRTFANLLIMLLSLSQRIQKTSYVYSSWNLSVRLVASLHMLHEPSYHTTHIYLLYHFFVGFLQVPHILETGIVKGQLKYRVKGQRGGAASRTLHAILAWEQWLTASVNWLMPVSWEWCGMLIFYNSLLIIAFLYTMGIRRMNVMRTVHWLLENNCLRTMAYCFSELADARILGVMWDAHFL